MKITPKGFLNAAKFDAETHNKSMQKLGQKKKRNIIKNNVFLKCKNMQIYCKGHQIGGFCKVGARTGNPSKNHQKLPKSISKSMKNQCKIHARKRDAKNIEISQKWSPKGSQNN